MKKVILFMAIVALCSNAKATVITVSNNANSPGQYTNLQTAIDSAAANDTLYISGSPTQFGGYITLNKPLTLIGAGGLPNKTNYYATRIQTLVLVSEGPPISSSSSGSKIIGCEISALYIGSGALGPVGFLEITRNRIEGLVFTHPAYGNITAHTNINVYNNVIAAIGGYGQKAAIKNSVFKNNLIYTMSLLGDDLLGSWVISNNFIYGFLSDIESAIITNNVIYTNINSNGVLNAIANNTYCSFYNNCLKSAIFSYSPADIIYGSNVGSNNLLNQDPLLGYFDYTNGPSVYTEATVAPFANLNLQVGSTCKLAGSDGTDIGIYGGATPFIEGYPADSRYRYFPMPPIPQMLEMNIANSAILPAGTLNVNFKARKQN